MENRNLPKILVVSINAWRDNTGINTLIDFFKDWDKDKLAQIYTRSILPRTYMCDNFFQISENAVIKSIFVRNTKTGKVVYNQQVETQQNKEAIEIEQKRYSNKRKRTSFMSLCREFVWNIGKWKTKELNKFIDDFDPEVLFFPIYPTVYMGKIQRYILKRAKKPIVAYLADDNYTYRAVKKSFFSLWHRFLLRKQVKYLIKQSSQVLVIAPKQKEEYDRIFGVNSKVLTKGIDFTQYPLYQKPLNVPIKMVYTGKLIIGRWKSLAAIADALGEINKTETKIELDIYTTDELTKKQERALNKNGCQVKGALTLEQVQGVQARADILVFVESLERKYKNAARLSFSTKITDYLKSGKCIFAIGDKEIAPIDYFQRYDSAVTATSYKEIAGKLQTLVNNPALILEYGEKAYNCGKEHHDKDKMRKVLLETIESVRNGE